MADPNLSLMAWRSAIIANSLLGRQVYDVSGESSVLDFDKTSECRYLMRGRNNAKRPSLCAARDVPFEVGRVR